MDEVLLSEELNEFLNANLNSSKSRTIRECLDYANILSNSTIGNIISVEKLNEILNDIINDSESLGKDETIITVELMIFNTLIVWLDKIGIQLDRDILIEKGSKFSNLKDIYLALINLIEPEITTSKFILQCIEADYEDNIERLSVMISEGIPNTNFMHYYEFITEVDDSLIKYLKDTAEIVVFKDNPDVDNNLINIINKLATIDRKFINTYIVKEILNFDRGSQSVIVNIQAALSYIINEKLDISDIPFELIAAVLLSDEYSKIKGANEFLAEVNLDSLIRVIGQNDLEIIRRTVQELMNKIK